MFSLSKITTDNLISIMGIALTILTIFISIWQFAETIKHSIIEAKQEKQLEKTDELPLQIAEFCNSASSVAVGVYLGPSGLTDEMKSEFENAKERQDELLPTIKNSILAYGSTDAIKVFLEFENIIGSSQNGSISINAYYLLPLLLAEVKMDVTGEIVNPLILFNTLMPQFKEHSNNAKTYINKTIVDLELSPTLMIPND